MKRFILSAFSVLLATAAVAPTAQALPKIDTDFNVQTLRLREFDARNKSDEGQQPYYPQSTTQASPQGVMAEPESIQTAEPSEWDEWSAPESAEKDAATTPSLTARRQQSLDRN